MRPIGEMTAEQARTVRGVCFDVDDTLTTEGVLDPEAYASLHALKCAGLWLIAATGRPLGWAELFARTWPLDAAVGENGAGWHYRRDGVLAAGFARSAADRESDRARLAALRDEVARQMPHVRESSDSWCRRCDLAFDVGEHHSLDAKDRARLVAIIEASGARAVVSSVHAHAAFGDTDKAQGIVAASRDALGVDPSGDRESWLFVGDSGNDAAAFVWFPLSAGVANVIDFLPQLPRPPRFVSRRRSGGGFAEIAQVLLQRRGDAATP